MEWQPIETAPKDGTVILIGSAQRGVYPAYWGMANTSFGGGASTKFPWVFLDPTNGCNQWADVMTHWMPIPTPPKDTP